MRGIPFLLMLACAATAQDPQTARNLVHEARRITAAAALEVSSRETWEPLRARRLEEMRDSLGLLPWPAKSPLRARTTKTIARGVYPVDLVAFESLPQVSVPATLYLPKPRTGKVPGIIYVCGHAFSEHGNKTAYQRHGISFARNGYAAIILDSVQTAETFGTHHEIRLCRFFGWNSRACRPAGL